MDLNRKYSDHQKAVMRASEAHSDVTREGYLGDASDIAAQIGEFQRKLGAAASCAWSVKRTAAQAAIGAT
jgi:hypothetical protein